MRLTGNQRQREALIANWDRVNKESKLKMAAKWKQASADCTEVTETRQKVSEMYREVQDAN